MRRQHYPAYRLHKPSGQAIVVLSGKMIYLGPYGSPESHNLYDQQIAEWLANGRRVLSLTPLEPDQRLSVVELCAAYLQFAQSYYQKDGKPTGSMFRVKAAVLHLKSLYGKTPAVEFGPLKLRAIQARLIDAGKSRRYVNYIAEQIKRMFKWGVSMEMAPASVYQALNTVSGLRRGRSQATEPAPILPVDDAIVDSTLPFLSLAVADMVRFQRLTGARPGEVCIIRPCDIDMTSEVWKYVPSTHKTEHHGRQRVILIGPKAQDVLRAYLLRPAEGYCFSPADAVRKLRESRTQTRVTPLGQGNRPGTNRRRSPLRSAGSCYTSLTYGRAIARACEVAFGMPEHLRKIGPGNDPEIVQRRRAATEWRVKHCWHANQLRHSVATQVRREFGLEAAQCVLGHSRADITQIYAERDMNSAAEVAAQIG
jgi:integrase